MLVEILPQFHLSLNKIGVSRRKNTFDSHLKTSLTQGFQTFAKIWLDENCIESWWESKVHDGELVDKTKEHNFWTIINYMANPRLIIIVSDVSFATHYPRHLWPTRSASLKNGMTKQSILPSYPDLLTTDTVTNDTKSNFLNFRMIWQSSLGAA